MVNKIPEPTEPVTRSGEPPPMLRATVEPVPGAAPTTVVLSLHNDSDGSMALNKTIACFRGRLGSDVFVIFPERDSKMLDERVKYIGRYVEYANENGENEFVLGPREAMVRELSLAESYDFASWRERGCSRFWVRYSALHDIPGKGLETIESAPLLIEL